MKYLYAVLFTLASAPGFTGFTDFILRGGKHCTGFCDKNLNCQKGVDKQGYYDWCKKNCTHDSKTNRQDFLNALKTCDTFVPTNSQMSENTGKIDTTTEKLNLINAKDQKGQASRLLNSWCIKPAELLQNNLFQIPETATFKLTYSNKIIAGDKKTFKEALRIYLRDVNDEAGLQITKVTMGGIEEINDLIAYAQKCNQDFDDLHHQFIAMTQKK